MTSKRMWKIVALIVSAVLLLSMLTYPFGYDQAVFAVGGEMLLHKGALCMRDFLDTKPPVVFIFYAASSLIFGHHEWAIRALDIVYHVVALWVFYKILVKALGDEDIAFLSVILYTLLYVTSGYWMTAQTETFAMLPTVLLFGLSEHALRGYNRLRSGLLVGALAAMLFLIKFTLLYALGAAIIAVFLNAQGDNKRTLRYYFLGAAVSFVAVIGAYFAFLALTGGFGRFVESVTWLGGYSSVHPLLSVDTLGNRIFKDLPIGLVVSFSLTFIVVLGISVQAVRALYSNRKPFHHLAIQLGVGLLTVIYERKFSPYHFSRVYWCAVPFIAIGLREVFRWWRSLNSNLKGLTPARSWLSSVLAFTVIMALLFYSPLPRIIPQPLHWSLLKFRGEDPGHDIQAGFSRNFYGYADQKHLAAALRPILTDSDQIFLWGNSAGLYFWLDKLPTTICLTNTPFVSPWTPATWKTTLLGQLRASPPRYFVVETEDDREDFTGDTLDSRQHLEAWADLSNFVHSTYRDSMIVDHFIVYERNRR